MTPERQYPYGLDCVWLASDRDGHIGAFLTGGVGPIPVRALAPQRTPIEDVEERIAELPVTSEARLLIRLKDPAFFIELAQRGLFAYDWSDVHRKASEEINAYEQVAAPEPPLKVADLPLETAELVAGIALNVSFAGTLRLDLAGQLDFLRG